MFLFDFQVLGGKALQEVAQKLVDHHAKMTNIFKEMYGDVRSVPPPPTLVFSVWCPHDIGSCLFVLGIELGSICLSVSPLARMLQVIDALWLLVHSLLACRCALHTSAEAAVCDYPAI